MTEKVEILREERWSRGRQRIGFRVSEQGRCVTLEIIRPRKEEPRLSYLIPELADWQSWLVASAWHAKGFRPQAVLVGGTDLGVGLSIFYEKERLWGWTRAVNT